VYDVNRVYLLHFWSDSLAIWFYPFINTSSLPAPQHLGSEKWILCIIIGRWCVHSLTSLVCIYQLSPSPSLQQHNFTGLIWAQYNHRITLYPKWGDTSRVAHPLWCYNPPMTWLYPRVCMRRCYTSYDCWISITRRDTPILSSDSDSW
jgi:hypothetical protein